MQTMTVLPIDQLRMLLDDKRNRHLRHSAVSPLAGERVSAFHQVPGAPAILIAYTAIHGNRASAGVRLVELRHDLYGRWVVTLDTFLSCPEMHESRTGINHDCLPSRLDRAS